MSSEVIRIVRKTAWAIDFAMVLTIAVLAFFCRFGFSLSILNPQNYGWLLQGDVAQSFIGWLFFYFGSWQWPLGLLPNYVPVFPATIALTDSHPWFSILMKLTVPKGSEPLQFIGLWLLLCYFLQALFAMKIARLFFRLPSRRILLTLLLTFSPLVFFRINHVSLCAHWLILAALYLCFRQDHSTKTLLSWFCLAFLASLTHPYFLPPVALFALLFYVVNALRGTERTPALFLIGLLKGLFVWTGAFCGLWLVGLLSGSDRVGVPNYFSADVFALFNPQTFGFFLPPLWTLRMGQYEGYGYLGLGVLVMLLGSIYVLWKERSAALRTWKEQPGWQVASFVAVGLMIWSWGSDVRFFGHFLVSLRPFYYFFEPLIAPFRSSGRFIWTMCYLLTIFSFYVMNRYLPPKWSLPILSLCVAIQLIDLSPYYQSGPRPAVDVQRLDSPAWNEFAKKYTDIVMYPPYVLPDLPGQIVADRSDYIPLAVFAATHNMKLYSGAFVVPSEQRLKIYLAQMQQQFDAGIFQKDSLYILNDAYERQAAGKGLVCRNIDGYHVCELP